MGHLWAILLAGGEGVRVRELTRSPAGAAVPKQFCCFRDRATLLGRTLERARAVSGRRRVVPVVMEHHRCWWSTELDRLPSENVVVQSGNHGTAGAVFLALARILPRDPGATVVIFPSDHDIEDEAALRRVVDEAVRTARRWAGQVVLVGVEPEEADPEYGWIIPSAGSREPSRAVLGFIEKPDAAQAARLCGRGALVSTLIAAAEGAGLMDLLRSRLPELLGPSDAMPARDFSRDVLMPSAANLRVLRAPRCGWTDLGTPHRVRRWRESHGAALVS
jgi:mannose-1-phosphate guanylyltransferase